MLVLGYETHGHWTLNAITGFRFEQALLFPRRFGWTRRRASSSAVLYRDIWVPHRTAHRRAEARKHSRGSTSHPITVKEHACTYTRAQIMTSSRAFTLMLRSITTSYSARAQACTFVLPFENASTTDRLCLASVHPASGLHDLLASPISKSSASSFGNAALGRDTTTRGRSLPVVSLPEKLTVLSLCRSENLASSRVRSISAAVSMGPLPILASSETPHLPP